MAPQVPKKVGTHFRPLDRYPAARQHPAIKVLRLRANLFFANCGSFRTEMYASIIESEAPIKCVNKTPYMFVFGSGRLSGQGAGAPACYPRQVGRQLTPHPSVTAFPTQGRHHRRLGRHGGGSLGARRH